MTSTDLLMPLLNEGTDVWRPVSVTPLDDGTYQIIGPMPEDEQWAFAPGSIVVSRLRTFANGEELPVAALLANELLELAMADGGWRTLYRHRSTGRLWESSYPNGEMHGGGPRRLQELSIAVPEDWH